jgi:hypothetical protein
MTRAIVPLLLFPSLLFAQVPPERAAAQSMKEMALHESEKLLQNLQEGDARAIVAKCARAVDYYDKGRIPPHTVLSELQKYFKRWSDRQYSNIEAAIMDSNSDLGIFRVQVDFNWTVEALSGATKSGRSRIVLVWKGTINDNISITSWKEERL